MSGIEDEPVSPEKAKPEAESEPAGKAMTPEEMALVSTSRARKLLAKADGVASPEATYWLEAAKVYALLDLAAALRESQS